MTYLACRARAITPATRGVAALVPVKDEVHLPFTDVVVWNKEKELASFWCNYTKLICLVFVSMDKLKKIIVNCQNFANFSGHQNFSHYFCMQQIGLVGKRKRCLNHCSPHEVMSMDWSDGWMWQPFWHCTLHHSTPALPFHSLIQWQLCKCCWRSHHWRMSLAWDHHFQLPTQKWILFHDDPAREFSSLRAAWSTCAFKPLKFNALVVRIHCAFAHCVFCM